MNSKKNEISFVIPTYNRRHIISRSIDSVLNNYPLANIIIVDDGSTDATFEYILAKYNYEIDINKIIIKRLPQNFGVNYSRNYGFSLVEKGWVLFLDSDDEIIYDAALFSELDIYNKVSIILFRCINKNNLFIGKKNTHSVFIDSRFYLNQKIGEILIAANRDVIRSNGIFNQNYCGYELLAILTIAEKNKFILLSSLTIRIYHHDQSNRLSSLMGFLPRLYSIKKGHLFILKNYIHFLSKKNIIRYFFLFFIYTFVSFFYNIFKLK